MAGDAGLVDVHARDEVVDGLLAGEEGLDDPEAVRIRERLNGGELHDNVYVY